MFPIHIVIGTRQPSISRSNNACWIVLCLMISLSSPFSSFWCQLAGLLELNSSQYLFNRSSHYAGNVEHVSIHLQFKSLSHCTLLFMLSTFRYKTQINLLATICRLDWHIHNTQYNTGIIKKLNQYGKVGHKKIKINMVRLPYITI